MIVLHAREGYFDFILSQSLTKQPWYPGVIALLCRLGWPLTHIDLPFVPLHLGLLRYSDTLKHWLLRTREQLTRIAFQKLIPDPERWLSRGPRLGIHIAVHSHLWVQFQGRWCSHPALQALGVYICLQAKHSYSLLKTKPFLWNCGLSILMELRWKLKLWPECLNGVEVEVETVGWVS